MLNIFLYIVIGAGVGYFAYLVYKKWPQLKQEEFSSVKPSFKSIKRLPQNFLRLFKKILQKIRGIRLKKIWHMIKKINFSKIISFIKKTLKQLIKALSKIFRYLVVKTKNLSLLFKKIKLPKREKKQIPFFKEEPVEDGIMTQPKKELLKLGFKFKIKLPKLKKPKTFFSRIKSKINSKIRQLKFRAIRIFFKELKQKVKIRIVSQEDKKIKKRLEETREKIVSSESYLGELLKKTEAEKQKPEEIEDVSLNEAINEWLSSDGLIAKPKSKQAIELKTAPSSQEGKLSKLGSKKEKSQERTSAPTEAKKIKERASSPKPEISQETLKKIENKLIQDILEDSKNIEAYKKLGKIYFNQDKFEYAKECFEAAIKLGSGDKKIKDLLSESEEKIAKG